MKKKLVLVLTAVTLSMSVLVGCGASSNDVSESTETVAETPTATLEETEVTHEHAYTEEITTAPTCLEAGVKTFTCECGDTYTVEIPATGHIFENYVSNNDATCTADGTETAKCNNCDETDTRTAEGSMLTYTYTDMDATKFAKSTVNVRSLPNTDGEKLGGLSQNDEVKVTGKCNETGWYRISYNDSVAYVSDSYLVDQKVEVAQASAPAKSSSTSAECPYQLWTMYNNGSVAWFYGNDDHIYDDTYWNAWYACKDYNDARFHYVDGQVPGFEEACVAAYAEAGVVSDTSYGFSLLPTPYYVNGHRVYAYFAR